MVTNDLNDTIVAISTPFGKSGIGIVRLSGKNSIEIVDSIFQAHSGIKLNQLPSHTVRLGYIKNEQEIIDEVLVCVMRAPKTYTREDIVEISGHGGPVVLNRILNLCIEKGARFADPGEFTKRAFLNGRIDLTQAEAVCDLINAKTEFQERLFLKILKGEFKEKVNTLKEKLKELLAYLELSIDFVDEDITFLTKDEIKKRIIEIKDEINKLIEIGNRNRILRDGARIAIIGKPNVGKSSILNSLLKEDRVIVSPIAGTTRDAVSDTFNLKGIPVTIIDTAGIKQHLYDTVEKLANEKTMNILKSADVLLCICDLSTKIDKDDIYIFELLKKEMNPEQELIIVLNKVDLPQVEPDENWKKLFGIDSANNTYPFIKTSAKNNIGIDKLENELFQTLIKDEKKVQDAQSDFLAINLRCQNLLKKSKKILDESIYTIENGYTEEIISLDIRRAIDALSEITGEITTEDILDHIFSNFCIGK